MSSKRFEIQFRTEIIPQGRQSVGGLSDWRRYPFCDLSSWEEEGMRRFADELRKVYLHVRLIEYVTEEIVHDL